MKSIVAQYFIRIYKTINFFGGGGKPSHDQKVLKTYKS